MAEVISLQPPEPSRFSHSPLRSSASHTSFFDANSRFSPNKNSYSYTDLRAGSLSSSQSSSFQSTPSSSLSLDTKFDTSSDDDEDDDDDDVLSFPTYCAARSRRGGDKTLEPPSNSRLPGRPPPSPVESVTPETPVSTPDPLPISEDDTAVRLEPTQHVDYLSHEWNEEDIWSSWRHIVEHRRVYGERSRLENASWRTWAKSQFKLKTVSPETLNWLKDCDVTWLYGPLQPASNRSYSQHASEPVSRLSKNNSFINKKPILKKRSMSEAMLQKSLSASSLVKQAAASVQAQQQASSPTLERRRPRPIIRQTVSDFASSFSSRATSRDPTDYFTSRSTSGLQTPDQSERKHIRFDDKVEQCIAVDCKEADDEEEDYNSNPWAVNDDDGSSDEGVVMMKRSRRRKKPLSRTNSRSSFTNEGKTIAMLPSTTLKYRTDSPDVTEQQPGHSLGFWRSSRLSPSPSQETLRPSNPSTNFLLAEEDEEDDEEEGMQSSFSGAFEPPRASTPTQASHLSSRASPESAEPSESGGLRRTASGMFMPFDDEDDGPAPPGIMGRVVDTVNTARDIAHVIWNVGWRT